MGKTCTGRQQVAITWQLQLLVPRTQYGHVYSQGIYHVRILNFVLQFCVLFFFA